jgi:molybdopterin-guanine dinucleotide biosynthesis protein B
MAAAALPKAIGFYGASGSGKTTLIVALLEHFAGAGLRVAAVKHAHHGFDMDRPGKDSHRFREAGARQVLVASERRWALLSELAQGEDPAADAALARQLARFDACDVVFVEGFRGQAGIPFIHVRRRRDDPAAGSGQNSPDAAASVPGLVAIATDEGLHAPGLAGIPLLDLNDIEAIARFVAATLKLAPC